MPIYNTLYSLVEQYIFGTITPDTPQELATILLSLIGSIFILSVPFLVVWRIIRIVVG